MPVTLRNRNPRRSRLTQNSVTNTNHAEVHGIGLRVPWTVLGDDDAPVEPIERYLSYLTAIERSPNTIKANAHDLKDYWIFAGQRELDWREVRLEDIAEFVAWLRLPPAGRAGAVAVLPSVEPHVGAATICRKLSALATSALFCFADSIAYGA
jgi:hypothetical protein